MNFNFYDDNHRHNFHGDGRGRVPPSCLSVMIVEPILNTDSASDSGSDNIVYF